MEPNTDPRYLRVRRQLNEAAMRLAARKPADSISVSELTREAGVSRTTFYKHGNTAAQFIADAIVARIEPQLRALVDAMAQPREDYLLRWREIYVAMLKELQRNEGAIRNVFADSPQPVVVGHFTDRLTAFFENYVQSFREHISDAEVSGLWHEMAVSQQVYNLVAVIVGWLRAGMEDPPEVVVNTYLSLAPPWQLARFDAAGQVSLKRSRMVADLVVRAQAEKLRAE